MKIAYVTESIANYVSGGLLVTISILNELKKMGHDVCCFIKNPPLASQWLQADFPIYSMDKMDDYDGILIAAFSPIAEEVAKATKAKDRLYHVHTIEGFFKYNGPEWAKRAEDSYKLPLKMFCTSTYVQIMMEMVYKRNVIGQLVPPGVDTEQFKPNVPIESKTFHKLRVGTLGRNDWIRGVDVFYEAAKIVNSFNANVEFVICPTTSDRNLIANFYKNIDIFVDPSRLAGSSVCIKEAMACGNIVLTTKYGSTDVILPGFNGYIIPVNDVQVLASLLIQFSEEDKGFLRDLAMNARASILGYNWESVAKMLLAAIAEGERRGDWLLEKKEWK